MLSLYIHIPFCYHKCAYCSFFVVPENDDELKSGGMQKMKRAYMDSLLKENEHQAKAHADQQIRTIYIGGGTPFQLGQEGLFELIDDLLEKRDVEYLEELTIELNPDPFDEVINFVAAAQKRYKQLFRLRFSFGIQTFDDSVLRSSKRNYIYNNLIHRFRELVEIKASTTCYNLDFIAFGHNPNNLAEVGELTEQEVETWLPWDVHRREFFQKMVTSQAFDGYSVYTLELFPGAQWYYDSKKSLKLGDETEAILSDSPTIRKEFQWLKNTVMKAGYHRNEISNFALTGKRSLHNMVYRNMENYLGLGINASSCLLDAGTATRFKNTTQRKSYLAGERKDTESDLALSADQVKSEKVMLGLRTDRGITLPEYMDVLVDDVLDQIEGFVSQGYCTYDETSGQLTLTSMGLDVYNSIVLSLIKDFS